MAIVELKVPSPGESITEVIIARWVKNTGDIVQKDEVLAEVDSDKATLTLNAEEAGKIEVLVPEGETVKVGQVVVKIDTSFKVEAKVEVKKEAEGSGQSAASSEQSAVNSKPSAASSGQSAVSG
ncbi:MAG: dihydrolipoyllysine-residue succinyltransferase, partial [bacterium]|nr:dihydrolipoyllysine-residue succinyltransferase [bacterium]